MLTPKAARPGRPWAAIVLFAAAGIAVLASFLLQSSIAELGIGFTSSTAPGALLTGLGMLGCAASMYSQPTTRVLAGWLGGALALVALPAANFGGFVVGTLLGVLGAAAALAWTESDRPARRRRMAKGERSRDGGEGERAASENENQSTSESTSETPSGHAGEAPAGAGPHPAQGAP